MEYVILVDQDDQPLGLMEKMEAHEKGLLHRAFSAFLFNADNELLLQKRAKSKYHSGGLWTNTCCSHPRENEELVDAVKRRLQEEMGIDADIDPVFSFIYKAKLDKGLTEHELDHVYFGSYDGPIDPNPDEVEAFRFISKSGLLQEIDSHPERFTEWFKVALPEVLGHWPSAL